MRFSQPNTANSEIEETVGNKGGIKHCQTGNRQVRNYLTELTKGVKPCIRTSSRSPEAIGPTPLGVPVQMMSPGSNVMFVEMKLTS